MCKMGKTVFEIFTNNTNLGLYQYENIVTPQNSPISLVSVPDFASWVNSVVKPANEWVADDSARWGGQSIVVRDINNDIVYKKATRLTEDTYPQLEVVTVVGGQTRVENKGTIDLPPYARYNVPAIDIVVEQGTYEIEYKFANEFAQVTAKGYIAVVENRYPLKKWTITEVLNRTFDLIEPLDYGQKPRFRLSGVIYDNEGNAEGYESGSLAEKLDKILSPEFSFTKMTLREQLQQVGGFIHAEPRIIQIHFDEDKPWFEVGFDKYGLNEKAIIKNLKKPVTATYGTDINNYATNLDSSADNLISQIDYANGVIVEPFYSGDKTLRCETATMRMEENDNTFISTAYPIYQLHRVVATYIPHNTDYNGADITPYIFEKDNYKNTSSFSGTYPTAKSYALYYTQGQKNIRGLFFKNENAINTAVFSKYSILNILRTATGNNSLTFDSIYYPELTFQVEYTPSYGTRIQTAKQTIINSLPRSIAYNQSANNIESRYYGENLKGVIARMGNVEKQLTYNLAFISDIPKVGTKYDEHYYISTVSTEYLPSYIKCTLALSKDFNRLSEYIGISSNKRMWEVSEKQSQARDSVHTEYVLITENAQIKDDEDWFINEKPTCLLNKNAREYPVSGMNITTFSKRKKELAKVTLPVISSSFGNAISFTSSFEDNYSAGQSSTGIITGGNNVQGIYGQYVPYGDYFGRFYYLYYSLWGGKNNKGETNRFSLPRGHINNDNGNVGATVGTGKKYRKDSREIPQITFQLSVVTDNDDIIIGSAISRNCWLVNRNPSEIELYIFNKEINKINSIVDFESAIKVSGFEITDDSLILPSVVENHVAWALVTKQTKNIITVEDEDGDVTEQTIYKGGELILGQNLPITNGKTLYFKKKKYVYD